MSTCGAQIVLARTPACSRPRRRRARRAKPRQARQRVGKELARLPGRRGMLDAEHLPDAVVVLAARGQAAEHAHQRERAARRPRRRRAPTCRVSSTASRRRRRRSPSQPRGHPLEVGARRHLQQPLVARDDRDPAAGRLDERRAVRALRRRRAARSTGATNACGVCTATSSSRTSVSATPPSARASPCRPPAAPARRRRSPRRAPRAAAGRSPRPAARAGPRRGRGSPPPRPAPRRRRDAPTPCASRRRSTHAATFDAPSSSASRIAGSSHSGGATTTTPSIHVALVEPPQRLGQQRQAAEAHERLRPVVPEPIPSPGGDENGPELTKRRPEPWRRRRCLRAGASSRPP